MESEHALISPSSFYRTKNCPGHLYDTKDLPDKETVYSRDGVEVHDWGATALKLALKGNSPEPSLNRLDEAWKVEMATQWVDFCIGLDAKLRTIADKTPIAYVEERVKLTGNVWGTADYAITFIKNGKQYLVVADLKTGSGHKVHARDPKTGKINDQLGLYALCFAESKGLKPEQYFLYIFQPAHYDEGFDKTKATPEEMEELKETVLKVEKRALKILKDGPKDSDYAVGPWCGPYCKVFSTCKYFKGEIKSKALPELDDNKFNLPAIKDTSLDRMLKAYSYKSQVEDWLSAVEHHLMELLLKGHKEVSKHYKLVHSRASSKWKENTEKVAAGLIKAGIKKPFKKDLIGITEARKLAKKPIDNLIEKRTPKLQIAAIDDPREAVGDHSKALENLTELKPKKEKKNDTRTTKSSNKKRNTRRV